MIEIGLLLVSLLLVVAGVGLGLGLASHRKHRVTYMVRFSNHDDSDLERLIIDFKGRHFSGGGHFEVDSNRLVRHLEAEGYTVSGVSNSYMLFHMVGVSISDDRSIFSFAIDPRYYGTLHGKSIVLVPRDQMLERAQ